jgi:hypothetical protein
LPDNLQLEQRFAPHLAPEDRGFLTVGGGWQNWDGATYVTWLRDLFGWETRPTMYFSASKLAFKVVPVPDALTVGAGDPGPVDGYPEAVLRDADGQPVKDLDQWDVFAIRDCNSVFMYAFRQHKTDPSKTEVYDRDGKLLARSGQNEHLADHMWFHDEMERPIGYAMSPAVYGNSPIGEGYMNEDHYHISHVNENWNYHNKGAMNPDGTLVEADPGAIQPWEMKYIKDGPSCSSLIAPQNRWVLAAVVQERAIRASRPRAAQPLGGYLFLGTVTVLGLLAVVVVYSICNSIFRMVYPPGHKEHGNPGGPHAHRMGGMPPHGPPAAYGAASAIRV